MKHWSLGTGACLFAAVVSLQACKKDDPGGNMMNAGTGGMAMAGSAGMIGAGMGAAGTTMGGAGMAGSMASGGGDMSCADADMASAPAALHAGAAEVLTVMSPCGFGSCHVGSGKAGLTLLDAPDLKTLLVGKTSCEAPNLPLVDGSGGDMALAKSYLWLKLVGPADPGTGNMTGDASWGTGMACGTSPAAPYGVRMPQSGTDMKASPERLGKVKSWICAGAPGPM